MNNPGALLAGPSWAVDILAVVGAVFALVFVAKAVVRAAGKKPVSPGHATAGESDFYQVHWRWRFDRQNALEYLAAFCPECDAQIHPRRATAGPAKTPGTVFHCENCRREICAIAIPPAQLTDTVERTIQQELIRLNAGRSHHPGRL
jgi:hypothetical protein